MNISVFTQYEINGYVIDSSSSIPLNGVKAEIYGTGKTCFTSSKGRFSFENISPEIVTITFSKSGYKSLIKTFTLDSSLDLKIVMHTFEYFTDTIDVNSYYYKKTDDVSTSFMNIEHEEIRRSPGAMEDVVRYFTSAPGVSIGSDINNEIIVRGGSPVENLTMIDGLTIQNPNHYGAPGSTNGVISYINLKLVKDVDFFTGGFPPEYGDRLSSVMDIKFRDGNLHKHVRDLNISAIGFGGFFEGPLSKKSSYMFSVRRSYYELIKDLLNTTLIPEYWDVNTKFSYNLSRNDKISFTGLFATDRAKPFKEGDFMYDTVNVKILSTGINYSKTGDKFKFNIVAGYVWNFYKVNYQDFILDINDNETSIRQELGYEFSKNLALNIFSGARYFFSKYNIHHGSAFNASNFYTPEVSFNDYVNTLKIAGGINVISQFFNNRLTINAGIRFDSFQLIDDKFVISPRIGVSYKLTPSTSLNANAGIYYQAPEILWVLVDPENRKLSNIRVEEIVMGVEHNFSVQTRLSIEPYLKQYYDYPVSVYDPNFIFINSGVEIYPNFLDKALSIGKGYFTGVDITLQHKNSGNGIYGIVTYSYSNSRFLALAGKTQQAEFDYGNQITAVAGYKFGFGLSLSAKFKFAKGRPYTPYDYDKSISSNRGIYDKDRYNKEKMPDYARLDIRVDKNFNLGNADLVIYIEVLNVLGRTNYYNYYWSSYYKTLRANPQFPRVPILGLSLQF